MWKRVQRLVVLNLTAPGLPKGQLVTMAVDNPGWMANTAKSTYKDKSLWVERSKVTDVQK